MRYPARAFGLLIAIGFVWGVVHLFGLEFASGEVYPAYSSLRSDPLGAKLLYDSLSRLPEFTVSRNYTPLELVDASDSTILLLGMDPKTLESDANILKKIAGRGNRMSITLEGDAKAVADVLKKSWPSEFVLFGDSAAFDNQSTAAKDRLDIVTKALGEHHRVIFDESHLGIQESGSVVSLARRFRLMGFATGLAICAALWLWRAASAFPPPRASQALAHAAQGRTSHSGLLSLLQRNIAVRDLPAVCWQQWLNANRRAASPDRIARAAAIASQNFRPLDAIREIQTVLHRRNEL